MSVYTRVNRNQLGLFLQRYALGDLIDHQGIAVGITNTNYAVQTSTGNYVMTLYENHSLETLDYILKLQHYLAENGVACATPIVDRNENLYSMLNNRPAAIAYRLTGEVCEKPAAAQCAAIGAELAKFHLKGHDFPAHRDNPCGVCWSLKKLEKLDPHLDQEDRLLLREEIRNYQHLATGELPSGSIHADLFHDNALFDDHGLSGIIDFDYACNDSWVYDLCITINDWCIDDASNINEQLMVALMRAYEQHRPLLEREHEAMPIMFRIAALRFWLSRLYDKTYPLGGELTYIKNPDSYKSLLVSHRTSPL